MNPIYYILGTALSIALTLFGWNTEGFISNIALILGGTYFGHILTEALNSPTQEPL
jgi:hypothetical protein